MSDNHINPKELRRPDLFQQQMLKLLSWADKNLKLLILAIVPIVLIIAGFYTWNYFGQRAAEKQLDELSKIDLVYNQEEESVSSQRESVQKEMEFLMQADVLAKAATTKAEGNSKAKSDPKSEKAKEEKLRDLQEKLKAIKADHSGSLLKFEEYAKNNMGNPAGWRAGLTAATILVERKEFEKAASMLGPLLDNAKSSVYQVHGRIYLSSILEETGKSDDAVVQLDKALAQKPQSEVAARVLFSKARILNQSGKTEDASKIFDEVVTNYGTTPEAEKARAARSMLR